MDRRNGGDPLVPPPRPPKSLPRVHRPRAPEPLMNANLPEKPNNNNLHSPSSISRSNSVISNNNNNSTTTTTTSISGSSSSSSSSVTASTAGAAGDSNQSQLLGINNNNNNNQSGVDHTPSLRHQFPPPLPPAPVSRSPQVNRSTKPNIIISNNNLSSSNNSRNNIHSPVTLPALPSSTTTTPSTGGSGGTTTPTLIFRRRPAVVTPVTPLITSAVPTLSSTIQQFDPIPSSPVTLAQPRPENERLGNEYVDTPFTRSVAHGRHSTSHSHPHQHPHHQLNNNTSSSGTVNNHLHHQQQQQHHGGLNTISTIPIPELSSSLLRPSSVPPTTGAITKQPVTTTFTKDSSTTALTGGGGGGGGDDEVDFIHSTTTVNGHALNSITCPKCRRCRCDGCQRLRPLPSKWMFGDCCYISAESVIDYMSCLCCVKALYYHCSKDHEFEHDSDTSTTCADDPCSCSPHHFASRWGCMAALSFVLPCLLCYWPMRGCAAVCTKCYATHARHGCRCPPGSVPPTIGLGGQPSKSGRSISNLLNRNPSTTTTTTTISSINNSHHNHAPSSPHQLNDRLLGSSPDY